MKTFIFCTSFFDSNESYLTRYQKWINYYNDHPFSEDKEIIIFDDNSDVDFITDERINVIQEDQLGNHEELEKINLYHFRERKSEPNKTPANSEGWWRSFNAAIKVAEEYDYEKMVHIESDAYLISKRVFNYVDDLKTGWTALYAPKYYFPESSLQVICKDQFENFKDFTACGYETLAGMGMAERITPFTHVEKKFVGDRYGETETEQMKGLDYFCQVQNSVQHDVDTIIVPE